MTNLPEMCKKKYDFGVTFCADNSWVADCDAWNEAKKYKCENLAECRITAKF